MSMTSTATNSEMTLNLSENTSAVGKIQQSQNITNPNIHALSDGNSLKYKDVIHHKKQICEKNNIKDSYVNYHSDKQQNVNTIDNYEITTSFSRFET